MIRIYNRVELYSIESIWYLFNHEDVSFKRYLMVMSSLCGTLVEKEEVKDQPTRRTYWSYGWRTRCSPLLLNPISERPQNVYLRSEILFKVWKLRLKEHMHRAIHEYDVVGPHSLPTYL